MWKCGEREFQEEGIAIVNPIKLEVYLTFKRNNEEAMRCENKRGESDR